MTFRIAALGFALVACGGETVEVRLCPSETLAQDEELLDRVAFLRVGFQELDGGEVVDETIAQGPVATFTADGIAEEDSSLSIWADGLEAADATRPLVTGSTPEPVRTGGIRPICICLAEPALWAEQCASVECELADSGCRFR